MTNLSMPSKCARIFLAPSFLAPSFFGKARQTKSFSFCPVTNHSHLPIPTINNTMSTKVVDIDQLVFCAKSVKLSDGCFESDPCQHNVKISYLDGSTKTVMLDLLAILKIKQRVGKKAFKSTDH